MKAFRKSIFLMRRDLRLEDNVGLREAVEQSDEVEVWFVLDERQVGERNPYRSEKAISFMATSLLEVDEALARRGGGLFVGVGKVEEVMSERVKKGDVQAVFVNEDYTPFSVKRDKALEVVMKREGIEWRSCFDLLLTRPGSVMTGDGAPYRVYSAFVKRAMKETIDKPAPCPHVRFAKPASKSGTAVIKKLILKDDELFRVGGRREGLKLLQRLRTLKGYEKRRDMPSEDGTSGLSAHHKFGTVSIRETYWASKEAGLPVIFRKELFWRDFFTHISAHFPHVYERNFLDWTERVKWDRNPKALRAWKEGRTGVPLVDAGMRELLATGYMHNRVRMVVASFLTKDLGIHWREGERYFAQHLIDYDPAVNNGNWQWVASTGVDAQPYFRIFNPFTQSKRYDPDAEYIKRWVPELNSVPIRVIHAWDKKHNSIEHQYPAPIVDHKEASTLTKKRFKQVLH